MPVRYYHPRHVREPGLVAEDFDLAGSWLSRFQQETGTGAEVVLAEAFDQRVRPGLRA